MEPKLVMSIAGFGDTFLKVDREIEMLKTALLYADNVDLYSIKGSFLNSIDRLNKIKKENSEEFLLELYKYKHLARKADSNAVEYIEKYFQLAHKKRKSKREMIALINLKKEISKLVRIAHDEVAQMMEVSGYNQFDKVISKGVMALKEIGSFHELNSRHELEVFVHNYTKLLTDVIEKGESYPYFDEEVVNIIRDSKALELDKVNKPSKRMISHGQLVGELFSRLPNVSGLSIEDVLMLREELEKPLVRFRASIDSLSRGIESEVWSNDFSVECRELFIREISPNVLEIEEAIYSNSLIRKTFKNLMGKENLMIMGGGSLFGLGVSHVSELMPLSPEKLGLAVGISKTIVDSYIEWTEEKRNIAKNNLYFYYRVGRVTPK